MAAGRLPKNDLSSMINEFIIGEESAIVDPITFITSPWGLNANMEKFPVQMFIIRCLYGMKLNDSEKTIEVPDVVNENILFRFTETEFLQWLYEEKRCNTNSVEGKNFHKMILSCGRRFGKSNMLSCLSVYELYRLLKRGNPSKYYGFMAGKEIDIINVATTDEQSGQVFNLLTALARSSQFFKGRIENDTNQYLSLMTDYDFEVVASGGQRKPSVFVRTGGCSSTGLLGKNCIMVNMDEFAWFQGTSGRYSGDAVYQALAPSAATFKSPVTGRLDSKVCMISSPAGKIGKFWNDFNDSFENQDTTIMFKMYSCLGNPTIASDFLKQERKSNRIFFISHYAAEFQDATTPYIDDEVEFRKCVTIPMDKVETKGKPGIEYFYGIDAGYKNDGSAIAITHVEDDKIILDYSTVYFCSQSDVWKSTNTIYKSCDKYKASEIFKMEWLVDEIRELNKWFPARKGIFDQCDGYALAEMLQKAGLSQFEMEHISQGKFSEMYSLFKNLYTQERLALFDHPVLIPELLSLEAQSKDKNIMTVKKQNRKGMKDDLSDAFVRSVWLSYNSRHGLSNGMVLSTTVNRSNNLQKYNDSMSFLRDKMKRHGMSPRSSGLIKRPYSGRQY